MYDAFHAGQDIDTEVIAEVLSKKTNLLTTMAEQLRYLLKWVGFSDKKNDGIRARYASIPDSIDVTRVMDVIEDICKDIEGKKPYDD
jgi:hypothetical protein